MASIKLSGDTSGEITISAPAVAGTTTLTLPATSSTLATQNALGVRNLFINGDMRIAQRSTSATAVGNGYHTADRFRMTATRTQLVLNVDQSTDAPDGFQYSYKYTITTPETTIDAGDYFQTEAHLEGLNTAHLLYGTSNAKTTTLSFWVKSSSTGVFPITLSNYAGDWHYPMSYTIDSANTWEYKTITIPGATSGTWLTNNSTGLGFRFGIAYGSTYNGATANSWLNSAGFANAFVTQTNNVMTTTNATWQITAIQLEIGDTATPFEHRPYDMEMVRCKRYYEKSYEYGTAVGTVTNIGRWNHGGNNAGQTTSWLSGGPIRYEVAKRVAATVTIYDAAGNSGVCTRFYLGVADSNNQAVYIADSGTTGFFIYSSGTSNGSGVGTHWQADAEL